MSAAGRLAAAPPRLRQQHHVEDAERSAHRDVLGQEEDGLVRRRMPAGEPMSLPSRLMVPSCAA